MSAHSARRCIPCGVVAPAHLRDGLQLSLLHWMVVSSSIVLIGPAHALPALGERLDSGAELHTFTDAEALEALDHVIRIKPRIVAIEKEFSATSRGRALINRITDDPSLTECEIRVIGADSGSGKAAARYPAAATGAVTGATPGASAPQPATAVVTPPAGPLDQRGTRRAPRVAVRDGVEVLVDGNLVTLVDISADGVQVLSAKLLRPNQRVRLALPEGTTAIRCDGSIAWASFEMPKGESPRYRAGIELNGIDPVALARYTSRHRRI